MRDIRKLRYLKIHVCIAALFISSVCASSADRLDGKVVDPQGNPMAGAVITLMSAQGTVLQETSSDEQGDFRIEGLKPGTYALKIKAAHFMTSSIEIAPETKAPQPLRIRMEIVGATSEITVTAARGNVQSTITSAQLVAVQDRDALSRLPLPTVGNSLESSPGIMVQQTSYAQSSPFMRGLTGYQTLLLLDGIRYNTSIFRSGPNQYIAYVNPSQLERIEAVLGPAGSAFGSDSMGGTINMLTAEPAFVSSTAGSSLHGEMNVMGASSDISGTADARVSSGTQALSWILGGTVRRLNNIRAGKGFDSRNAFHRYLGMELRDVRALLGSRLKDTAFSQYGADAKLLLHPGDSHSLTFQYIYGGIRGERSYRDQLGGPGRLQSRYFPQDLNFGYARYEKQRMGFLDSLTATFSINSQRDGAIKQNQKFTDSITTDDGRVTALGYSLQATSSLKARNILVFGGESYDERIFSSRFVLNPVNNVTIQQRAQYPNGTRYRISGLFAQDTSDIIRGRLKAVFGLRYTDVRLQTYANENRNASGELLGVTDTSQKFRDVTFNTGLTWQVNSLANLSFLVGRGFRAPNVTDMASMGLITQGGYDVPAIEANAAGAIIGADSGDSALSTGKSFKVLKAESLYSYELGFSLLLSRLSARVQVFDAELTNPISSRTLLFPFDRIPGTIAGMSVSPLGQTPAQQAQGVVAVQTSFTSRAVHSNANAGHSRFYGFESILRFTPHPKWHLDLNHMFIAGRDLNPNRARSKLPPQMGSLSVRYAPSGKYWLELRNRFAGSQYRLSGGDIDDDRIGASRSRSNISSFFKGGYVNSYLLPGADGNFSTADDVFSPTGESLKQIQDRVLPLGSIVNGVTVANDSTRVPLYLGTGAWWRLDVNGSLTLGENSRLSFGINNLFDRNYRVHGSGVDSSGFNAFLGFRYVF